MAISLANKNAIITGAGSGINLEFARALLSRECNVLIADLALRPEAQDLVARHGGISGEGGARALFQQTDVRDWSHLERMFRTAEREFGSVDIVCPGAGVYEPPFSNFHIPPGVPPSGDSPDSNHFASLDINLVHPIRTTQLALQHFLSSPSSSTASTQTRPPKAIILISSIAGQGTPLTAPIYVAAKHGINGFVRSLAPLSRDPRINVRVTAVAPGIIKTPLWTESPQNMRLVTDDHGWVTPEAVAEVMTQLVERDEVEVVDVHAISHNGGSPTASGEVEAATRKVAVQGGMILEVSKDRVRVVKQYMDPGPGGAGNALGNMGMIQGEILDKYARGDIGP